MAVLAPFWIGDLKNVEEVGNVEVTLFVKENRECVITFNVMATSLSQETRVRIAKSVKSCTVNRCDVTPTNDGLFQIVMLWHNQYMVHPVPNLTFSATLLILQQRGIPVTGIEFRNLEANIYCGKESAEVSDDDRGAIADALRRENPTLQEMFLTLEGTLTIRMRFPRPNYDDPLYQ